MDDISMEAAENKERLYMIRFLSCHKILLSPFLVRREVLFQSLHTSDAQPSDRIQCA